MVKLHITFDPPIENIHGESLWATPLGNDKYRLENHPVDPDLNFRDIVHAEVIDDVLEFQAFVMRDLSLS